MASRLPVRLAIVGRALAGIGRARRPTEEPRRILIAHELLLGDTLMLTPLLARLRARHPRAEIHLTVPPALLPLYAGHPYGVQALPYTARKPATWHALRHFAGTQGYDLALVPGDNRHALLARALGARWVRAFAGGQARHLHWCDELIPWPQTAMALSDIFALLAGTAEDELQYCPQDWPAPAWNEALPAAPYALLHPGSGSPLRRWPAEHWRILAEELAGAGLTPCWLCGPGETDLIDAADPAGLHRRLIAPPMAALWHWLAGARLLVCLDSGISHLARLTGTASVVLYGQGTPTLFGPGEFWRAHPFAPVWLTDFPCRDQDRLFGRQLPWVRRCQRALPECRQARCMDGLTPAAVRETCLRLLAAQTTGTATI